MLDIRLFRESPEVIIQNLTKRDMDTSKVQEIIDLDKLRREKITSVNTLKKERNDVAMRIRDLKSEGKEIQDEIDRMRTINNDIDRLDQEIQHVESSLDTLLMRMPNILHESVPVGEENVTIREWGERDHLGFPAKGHTEVLQALGKVDIERAAKIAGSRFYFLKDELVMLDYALMRFSLDYMTEQGYTLIEPPYMMKRRPYEGVTDLGDFGDVMYKVEDEDLYLIATSEHPMAAMYMDEIFESDGLPLKMAGISPCFRKEAGSHGKDTKGIFRVHQFNKVEQFIFCRPEESWNYLEELIGNAEDLYRRLEIPYRIVNICTGDIGTVAAKKYDLEAWMPAQCTYRELVSCSNCTDYQARRLNVRYRTKDGNVMCHTLNSTAIATTRTLVALVENYQNEDGSITIPQALRPYVGNRKEIGVGES